MSWRIEWTASYWFLPGLCNHHSYWPIIELGDETTIHWRSNVMQRRTCLVWAATAGNALIALTLGIPGVRFLLDPLFRKARQNDFVRVTALSSLPVGKPTRATILADRWDTYTHYPLGPIGTVWLIREADEKSVDQVRCLQSVCPHLGCGIDFVDGVFVCPCHASDFSIDGSLLKGPSPRPMDELQCRIVTNSNQSEAWVEVKYEEFQTGQSIKATVV